MTEHPRFILELSLVNTATRSRVQDPTLITDELVNEAWHLLNDFIMDMVDEQELEPTDEQFRELVIELCYRLIYREMTVLIDLPVWEENWKDRLAKGKRIQELPRRKKKGESE